MASETFLATFGLVGLRLVEAYGIEPRAFLREIGAPHADVPQANERLPSALLDKAFAHAASLIPDPAFGLQAAGFWHPSHLGTLGYGWLSSGSLRTALGRLSRYTKLLGQRMSSRCELVPEGLRYIYDPGRGDTVAGFAMADFGLSLVMSMCRANYGMPLAAADVSLRRPRPDACEPYERFFGCRVRFAMERNSLLLPEHIVDRPLPTSNHELAVTFDSILARQLAELGAASLIERCQTYLLRELTSGEPTEESLAAALALSRRTLQRKLAEQGLSYRSLLERTRHELALRYLDDPGKSVTDITFLLGFSEQSSFTRAFKRWTGAAPSDYRERLAAAG